MLGKWRKYLRLSKDVVLIFAVCNGFTFLWSGGCKAENDVGVIVAN